MTYIQTDKIKFDRWIEDCPIDNPQVIDPVTETTNDNGDWCYIVPVHVLIKRDYSKQRLTVKEEQG